MSLRMLWPGLAAARYGLWGCSATPGAALQTSPPLPPFPPPPLFSWERNQQQLFKPST